MRGHTLLHDPARREDKRFIEKLLCKLPVMGRRPASDIAWAEQRGHEDPGIGHDLLVTGEVKRHGNIEPMADAPQPAPVWSRPRAAARPGAGRCRGPGTHRRPTRFRGRRAARLKAGRGRQKGVPGRVSLYYVSTLHSVPARLLRDV